ncbi:thioredoxin domain-containing protein [Paroceanicella profunda]|uniref:Thioredoxin domain-containing protein n=1 Tax=Paroceanicella profunda TaxID=2579971 RepID=A0A5B8FVJ8_9RHOB|nr:thioredoxin domain-containing protein [Paroceanicella profunda]QDL92836.1 thioredoxin domain-containing protein [Paroceanicella profunda]
MTQAPPQAERSPETEAELAAAFAALGPDHRPRTHLMDGDAPRYVNRLIREASPYLLQHAHNPVDWWPWGEAALAEAARRDVPVFLSAGYATCHWCHVMEEESFDNEEIAALLNAHFVPVKLDRESRPDIDQIYIAATSLQNGHAGWPNSAWLLPDGRPFHTGTYFPKPQFAQVLGAIANGWKSSGRAEFTSLAGRLSDAIAAITSERKEAVPLVTAPDAAFERMARMFNPEDGGFSKGTQFPQEGFLLFLLDHWRRGGPDKALDIARRTLSAMAEGGIHDQVGGGFHRYTVDVNWRTPHFEKMLYNQALLLRCYTELHQVAHWGGHEAGCCVRYLEAEMTAPDGAFYAAEDADSLTPDGRLEEGAFYAWTPEQVRALLHPDLAEKAIAMLGIDRAPTLEAGAVAHLVPEEEVPPGLWDPDALPVILRQLHEYRAARARPLRDEKVIAGWNGLMIRALAEAALEFHNPHWAALAVRAAEAVFARLDGPDGLCRIHARGRAQEPALLSDYAWLGLACLALHDATGTQAWAERAEALASTMLARFDDGRGRLASGFGPGPFARIYETEDGAVPSGESSALELLARLALRRPLPLMRARAEALRDALSARISDYPAVWPTALSAVRILADGEAGATRVCADGALRVRLETFHATGAHKLIVTIAPGWHVAAAGAEGLAGAALEGAATVWPAPEPWENPHTPAPVPVHTGTLSLPLNHPEEMVTLSLQPCNAAVCLLPVTLRFRIR